MMINNHRFFPPKNENWAQEGEVLKCGTAEQRNADTERTRQQRETSWKSPTLEAKWTCVGSTVSAVYQSHRTWSWDVCMLYSTNDDKIVIEKNYVSNFCCVVDKVGNYQARSNSEASIGSVLQSLPYVVVMLGGKRKHLTLIKTTHRNPLNRLWSSHSRRFFS
jgi:hypothetical protein